MFMSVFSFVVGGDWFCEGFITVVLLSFFSAGGLSTVVLFSFFSAGGFVTVVSFCSHATNSATAARRYIYFFIQTNSYFRPNFAALFRNVLPISAKVCGPSFHLVSRHQAINNESRPDQRQRGKGQPNLCTTKEFRQPDADLRSNSCSGLHYQR